MSINYPLLHDVLPEVTAELGSLLRDEQQVGLAEQVMCLRLVERCRCGDSFCATLYTQPRPNGAYGSGHTNVLLNSDTGMIILDVVNGQIACVEILYRDEIRARLLTVLP